MRKRWSWVGCFDDSWMLFAASLEIGPARLTFWGLWDRSERCFRERNRRLLPWSDPEVKIDGDRLRIDSGEVRADLAISAGNAIECVCANGEGGYTWTRKLADVPFEGRLTVGDRAVDLRASGVVDESAGYHARRTSWLWSAGVGVSRDGRPLGWNLVEGINDPPLLSERAIWVAGVPAEPGPVSFEGLDGIRFEGGSRLDFTAEAERVSHDRIPLIARSDYRAPLGSFSGELDGIELEYGLGVIESHDVLW